MSVSDTGLSRRSLLKGSAVGATAAALGGTIVSRPFANASQIDLETPVPATPGVVPLAEPLPIGVTVASKAAELNYDVGNMFRFVADDVRYEPYAGALRGANGTLWSLAGNSVDKSMLFAALLDEALVDYRFAFGALDDAGIAALTARFGTAPDDLVNHGVQAQVQGLATTPAGPFAEQPATPPTAEPLTDTERRAVDDLTAASTALLERAADLTDQQVSLIEQALATAGIDLPVTAFELPELETTRHAWIQVADGPVWVDYALTVADAIAGTAPTAATPETMGEIPADLVHTVTFRIVAEEYIGGINVRRDAINVPFTSADLVNEPVSFLVVPPSSLANIGFTLNELFTGQAAYVPAMLANDIGSYADIPLMFGSGDGATDVLSAEPAEGQTLGEGEALALWLAVDITSPGLAPVSIERPLYDRVGFAARQEATIDFAAIEPVTMVTDAEGQSHVAGLASAHLISVDSAQIPISYALRDVARIETFGDLALTNPGLLALRGGLRQGLELPRGTQSWISSPQVTMVTASKEDPEDLESGLVVEFDLLHHVPSAFPIGNATGSAHPAVLAGITDQIAEQMMIEVAAESAPEPGAVAYGASAGSIFTAASEQRIDIEVLATPDDLNRVTLEPDATARIEIALDTGLIVIVPRSPVDMEGIPRSGWWLIDPATGHTRDELDSGKGSASLHVAPVDNVRYASFTEETFVIRLGTTASQYYRILGFKVFCLAMFGIVGLGLGLGVSNGSLGGSSAVTGAALGGATGAAGAAAFGGC